MKDASRDNQAFLHARLDLGSDPIAPYKETISRWVHPDVYKGQDYSVSKAKKAISDYKKAIGAPEGMAELTVHFCEEAIAFANAYGLDDESFYDALVRMFKQAVTHTLVLSEAGQERFCQVSRQPTRCSGSSPSMKRQPLWFLRILA